MTLTAPRRRNTLATRRFGYVVGALVNISFLWMVNIWPGWAAVPFLTADTVAVVGIVNACIWVNLAVNVVYAVDDRAFLKLLGSVASNTIGLFAMLRIWNVFPFDFGDTSIDLVVVTRVLLGVGIVGSVIAIVAGLVTFARAGSHQRPVNRLTRFG